MKLYVLCGTDVYEGWESPYLEIFYTKPTLEELKEKIYYKDAYECELIDILDGGYGDIGDRRYRLKCFDLDNNKLLEQINKSEE